MIFIIPDSPCFGLTIPKTNPLKAFLVLELKAVILVGSPLSVAIISPEPSTENVIWLFALATKRPLAFCISTLTKDRSLPLEAIFVRSVLATSFVGFPVVFKVSSFQTFPFL